MAVSPGSIDMTWNIAATRRDSPDLGRVRQADERRRGDLVAGRQATVNPAFLKWWQENGRGIAESADHRGLRAGGATREKTHDLVVRPGEHVRFTAINRTGTISFGLLFMLGAFPVYLTFERA